MRGESEGGRKREGEGYVLRKESREGRGRSGRNVRNQECVEAEEKGKK